MKGWSEEEIRITILIAAVRFSGVHSDAGCVGNRLPINWMDRFKD